MWPEKKNLDEKIDLMLQHHAKQLDVIVSMRGEIQKIMESHWECMERVKVLEAEIKTIKEGKGTLP